jgi:hypothetical protein
MPDSKLRPTRSEWENLGWRSAWSFMFAFTSVLTGVAVFDWTMPLWQVAVASGVGAVASVLKNFSSKRLGTQ